MKFILYRLVKVKEKGYKKEYKLKFNDSLLLLPLSLDKLTDALSIEIKNLPFPYMFIKKDNLDYIGDIPEYNYFYKRFDLKNMKTI
jgi:hypothetical protein